MLIRRRLVALTFETKVAAAVTVGMSLQTQNVWMLDASMLLNIEGDGQKSVVAKLAEATEF